MMTGGVEGILALATCLWVMVPITGLCLNWFIYIKMLAWIISDSQRYIPFWLVITLVVGLPLFVGSVAGFLFHSLGLSPQLVLILGLLFASPVSIPFAFAVANFFGWGLEKWEIFRATRRQGGT